MLSLLPALALILSAQTAPAPRHYLGESAFSFEYQGELKQVKSETVARPEDWIVKLTDWELDGEDIYIAASMFEGKAGTKMDKDFMKKAVDEFVVGMESESEQARMISNKSITIDDQLAQRSAYRIGNDREGMYIQSLFLTSGSNLYSLIAVYFEETGKSAQAAQKLLDSVRFKRPLEGVSTPPPGGAATGTTKAGGG
jgi:hypothetical protein